MREILLFSSVEKEIYRLLIDKGGGAYSFIVEEGDNARSRSRFEIKIDVVASNSDVRRTLDDFSRNVLDAPLSKLAKAMAAGEHWRLAITPMPRSDLKGDDIAIRIVAIEIQP